MSNNHHKRKLNDKRNTYTQTTHKNPYPEDIHKLIARSSKSENETPLASPRKEFQLLWEKQPESRILTIQHSEKVNLLDRDFEICNPQEVRPYKENEIVTVTGTISLQYSPNTKLDSQTLEALKHMGIENPPEHYKSKRVAVPEELIHDVLTRRFKSQNIELVPQADVQCIKLKSTKLSRTAPNLIPTYHLTCTITGNEESLNNIMFNGFGRAKNYGFGLLHPLERKQLP